MLDLLAPRDSVLAWVPPESNDLLHNGKPTRRAKVLFVCRTINHGPLVDFVDKDTEAFLKYYDVLNKVHSLQPKFTDKQLSALLARTDSYITFLIRIWQDSHNS